eukprot:gene1196-biopygen10328
MGGEYAPRRRSPARSVRRSCWRGSSHDQLRSWAWEDAFRGRPARSGAWAERHLELSLVPCDACPEACPRAKPRGMPRAGPSQCIRLTKPIGLALVPSRPCGGWMHSPRESWLYERSFPCCGVQCVCNGAADARLAGEKSASRSLQIGWGTQACRRRGARSGRRRDTSRGRPGRRRGGAAPAAFTAAYHLTAACRERCFSCLVGVAHCAGCRVHQLLLLYDRVEPCGVPGLRGRCTEPRSAALRSM